MGKKGISLSIVLAIIAIIVIGAIAITFVVKDNTNRKKSEDEGAKTANQADKIDDEHNEDNINKDDEEKLKLDGAFSAGSSSLIYIFNSDGTVEKGTNLSSAEGKYEINDKNEVKITFDKETIYDMDSGKTKINNINEVESFNYIDNDTLRNSKGEEMKRLEMN